jgi:hypothetical protein
VLLHTDFDPGNGAFLNHKENVTHKNLLNSCL